MSVLHGVYFTASFLIILSGCSSQTPQKVEPQERVKKVVIKKQIKKKTKNKIIKYKHCEKHNKIMLHASNYIKEEFKQGYFLQNDIIGAKAQLFLVENKSPTIFAQNINAAQNSYEEQYQLAKKNGCNVNNFKISPIMKVKNIINNSQKDKKVKK